MIRYNFRLREDKSNSGYKNVHVYIDGYFKNGEKKLNEKGHGPQLINISVHGMNLWSGVFHFGARSCPELENRTRLKIIGVDIFE